MKQETDPLRLKNQTGFPIYLCAKEITNLMRGLLAPYELTYTQFIIMMYLWEIGESNLKDAADSLLLDPSTLTPVLKKLEAKGYVTKQRSQGDERNLTIKLTERGSELREKLSGLPLEIKQKLGLDSEETKIIRSLMTKMLNNIKKEKYDGR